MKPDFANTVICSRCGELVVPICDSIIMQKCACGKFHFWDRPDAPDSIRGFVSGVETAVQSLESEESS